MNEFLPCAILVPSLNRGQRLEFVAKNIHEATPEDHRILFCVGDPASKEVLDRIGEWYLDDTDDPDKRYVTRMNKLIQHIGDAQTVFFGSDDVIHHPDWLSNALKVMEQGASVVVVNDLRNQNGTQALVRASYLKSAVFDNPKQAFHDGYGHNYADNEMFFTAYMQNQYARAMDAYVEHLHPVFGHPKAIEWDDTYTNATKSWEEDQRRFEDRAKLIEARFK